MMGDESVSESLKKLKPALEKVGACKHIIVPPIPRYFFAGCCQNPGHSSNVKLTLTHNTCYKNTTAFETQ
jgi:hypothetical protein